MRENPLLRNHPPSIVDAIQSINIPPRPAFLMALQHEMRKKNANLKKIAQLISRDAAMAGSLVEAANSSLYALSRRVETVQDAVALIGLNECGAIMTGLLTRRIFGVGGMMARFWDVSEKRAMGMSYMARQTHAVAPELAYSFGLFCDIGMPLLRASFPGYAETISAPDPMDGTLLEIENSRHGVNHALAGALLIDKWAISADVALAISLHHAHEKLQDESISRAARMLVALNYIVEKAINEYRGEPESREWAEGGAAAADALGMSAQDVDSMCAATKDHFRHPV